MNSFHRQLASDVRVRRPVPSGVAPALGLALGLMPVVACGPRAASELAVPPSQAQIITAEQIESSHARTAWEALRRMAPELALQEAQNGTPGRITRRGTASLYRPPQPVLVIDGVRTSDITLLANILAENIASIRILSGIDGTTYYGTDSVSGVIYIYTKGGTKGKERPRSSLCQA